MNKTAMTLMTAPPDLTPLSIAEQAHIKGGKIASCEEKRRPRKPK